MPNIEYESDCPFYGYHAIIPMGVLAASGGNQCALVTTCYAPCRMLIQGNNPNWAECPMQKIIHPAFVELVVAFEKHDLRTPVTLTFPEKGGPQ